jgi:hypothetical protein
MNTWQTKAKKHLLTMSLSKNYDKMFCSVEKQYSSHQVAAAEGHKKICVLEVQSFLHEEALVASFLGDSTSPRTSLSNPCIWHEFKWGG